MEAEKKLGKVTLAPEVLLTIVEQVVLETDGVTRLYGKWPENIGKLLGIGTAKEGIAVRIDNDQLIVDIHVVVRPDVQMLQLGKALQTAVARAIEDLAGLVVKEVNIHIEDVELEDEPAHQR
ncbi:MAG: Asp23/Gls24 family envelope stress response protein [Anaerolineae bacterium]